MYSRSIIAVSGLLSLVAAVPMEQPHHHHHKRDIVWVTETQEEVVTVPVTHTVWVDAGETPQAETSVERPQFTSHVRQTVTVSGPSPDSSSAAPATSQAAAPSYSSSSSSAYVAPTTSSFSTSVVPTPSSTSVYVAPTSSYVAPTTSSTSVYVAPTTSSSSSYVPPTTTSPAAYSSAPSADSGSGPTTLAASGGSAPVVLGNPGLSEGMGKSGTSYTGDLTNYTPGLGACGVTNDDSQNIVAVSHVLFESYGGSSNSNPVCRKTITIQGLDGNEYKAEVTDMCPGCNQASLDLPLPFFNKVTNNGDGRVHNVKWWFD